MNQQQKTAEAFLRLIQIMDELREKCPWDKKQTFQTLRSLTIEECYELAEAISLENPNHIKEELGDVLLHIVFYTRLAREKNWFEIDQMINALCEKLIFRHPHIYANTKVENEEDVKRNWEKLKQKEGKKGLLSGVPNGLPAMVKAWRMQEKTKQVGFEWKHIDDVWLKVEEEISELKDAIDQKKNQEEIELEFGDLLFSLINYGRFLNIDPELALEKVNQKFKSRFEYIEQEAPKPLPEMTLEEMELLWQKAKLQTQK